jgi:dipeptidyl aminopeptidase/acylaminoacyl peptidase
VDLNPASTRNLHQPTSRRLASGCSSAVTALAASVLVAACLAAPVPAGAEEPPHPFRPGDLAALREVQDPRISPDGAWVAYVVRTSDTEEDRITGDLWMTSWDGARTVQLTHTPKDGESTPRWSPDNRYLAFLAARGGEDAKTQVWLLDRSGGEARQLTKLPGGVDDFTWSPDGRRLALIASDPDPDEPAADAKEKDKSKTPKPIVIDRYWFKQDVTGYLRHLRDHLYLFDVASEKAELLTPGDYDETSPAWSPDGTRIAFVSKRQGDPDRNENTDVFVIEAHAGAAPLQLTRFEGSDTDPRFSPDGKEIAFLRGGPLKYRDYDPAQPAVIPAAGGEARLLAPELDRAVSDPAWSPDGASLLFLLEDDRSQQLARVPAGGGGVERLSEQGAVVQAFSAVGGRIALLVSRPQQPAEVFAFEAGRLRALSSQNRDLLDHLKLGAVEGYSARAADGNEVHGLLVRPPDFAAGHRYPTVAYIHGGPTGQDGFEFDYIAQTLAGAGYLVVQPNYRGSSGRGRDYSRALWGEWGRLEVVDVLASVDHVVAAGLADPERLGIGGWSYGAMTTNYTIARDSRFKAALSGAGISNQLTGYGTDQYVRQYELEFGRPWERIDRYLASSYPFFHADRIRTPTLFLCGEKDFNVPLVNSEQMYQALRSLGIETELVIYPGQHHGLSKPSYQKDRLERYLAWLDAHLKQGQ